MGYSLLPLERLTEQLERLPGIGRKSAARLAFHLLYMPRTDADALTKAIADARENIHECAVCCNLTDAEKCPVCEDARRDRTVICVVEDPQDVLAIERTREYGGLYHVLHGTISPMEGIGPEDIRIRELISRIDGTVEEVILATNPNVEGEATAMYIAKMPEDSSGAKYFYKNNSIYFNEIFDIEEMSRLAVHECIHFIQNEYNSGKMMHRCNYM